MKLLLYLKALNWRLHSYYPKGDINVNGYKLSYYIYFRRLIAHTAYYLYPNITAEQVLKIR